MKKLINFLVFTAILLIAVSAEMKAQNPTFSSGSGTASDPYLITSTADLDTLADWVNHTNGKNTNYSWRSKDKHFCLDNSIDTIPFSGTIGTASHPFEGTFSGNSPNSLLTIHIFIDDMHRVSPYVGLFGYTKGATIRDIKVVGSILLLRNPVHGFGYNTVGGIVGLADSGSTITNCVNETCIIVEKYHAASVGGIAGKILDGTKISNCSNRGVVIGNHGQSNYVPPPPLEFPPTFILKEYYYSDSISYAGGIVGYNGSNATIDSCSNSGMISAGGFSNYVIEYRGIYKIKHNYCRIGYAGGIVGGNYANNVVNQCVNIGNVISKYNWDGYFSGIIGYNSTSGFDTIRNCINSGYIEGKFMSGIAYNAILESSINTGNFGLYDNLHPFAISGDPYNRLNCWYDKQMINSVLLAPYSNQDSIGAKMTREIISGLSLDTSIWHVDNIHYPTLKKLKDNPIHKGICAVASMPLFLYNDTTIINNDTIVLFERIDTLRRNFRTRGWDTNTTCIWNSLNNKIHIDTTIVNGLSKGNIRIEGEDTLICSYKQDSLRIRKHIPINIIMPKSIQFDASIYWANIGQLYVFCSTRDANGLMLVVDTSSILPSFPLTYDIITSASSLIGYRNYYLSDTLIGDFYWDSLLSGRMHTISGWPVFRYTENGIEDIVRADSCVSTRYWVRKSSFNISDGLHSLTIGDISPSPVLNTANFNVTSSSNTDLDISIYNLAGNKVSGCHKSISANVNNNVSLDTDLLPAGSYTVIISGFNQTIYRNFIKR